LVEAVTEADVAAVGRQLLQQALGGDTAAAELLLRYVVGRARPAADPDDVDADELRRVLALPTLADFVQGDEGEARLAAALAVRVVEKDVAATQEEYAALLQARIEKLREEMREMRNSDLDLYLATEDDAEALGLDDDEDEAGEADE
jgi:hypothetical protein